MTARKLADSKEIKLYTNNNYVIELLTRLISNGDKLVVISSDDTTSYRGEYVCSVDQGIVHRINKRK